MAQVEPGNVLMNFYRDVYGWEVIWHSHTSDYARIAAVITEHAEPQPIIDELRSKGYKVSVEIQSAPALN